MKEGPTKVATTSANSTFYGEDSQPHCLFQSFSSGVSLHELGDLIRPDVVDDIMQEAGWRDSSQRLEKHAHKPASGSIPGDFPKYTVHRAIW